MDQNLNLEGMQIIIINIQNMKLHTIKTKVKDYLSTEIPIHLIGDLVFPFLEYTYLKTRGLTFSIKCNKNSTIPH